MKRILPAALSAAFLAAACTAADARSAPSADTAAPGKAAVAAPARTGVPRILQFPRPKGGEWFGLYVMGQKAGYAFSDVREGTWEGKKAIVESSTVTLKVAVGGVDAQREMLEQRFYEYADNGRLLAFRVEKRGDGGNEVLVGRCSPEGIDLTRKRPGRPDETRRLPPTAEIAEHADAPRLVAGTRTKVEGFSIDLENSLADKKMVSEFAGEAKVTVAGVTVPVVRVRTVEEGQNLATVTTIASDGRVLEIKLGDVVGKAEDEKVAKRLDKVDLFNLTRVTLDKKIPPNLRDGPAEVTFLIDGLPKEFRQDNYRQKFADAPGGATKLTVTSRLPTARRQRPIAAGDGKDVAEALRANLAVESEAPTIVETAKKVVGDETDAWTAAQRLNGFVYNYLEKAYGSSSDRSTDVLAARKGDCTEHSLLLAALARASGIPARRIDGLVYLEAADGVPALYWHEWVEVWVGEWVAIDPTFNEAVADATHIAFGQDGRSDTAGLIGQIKVKVGAMKPLARPTAVPTGSGQR